ncbi:hypothetical protein M6D81_11820 [Paenibacillus sp. J5C_2022]|uniref:hypothetical protein n=1 Tax=Paenibacillus sp. J5C2022 TaxID=2977129 RepID=UPI0021CE6148|nr:hypothetical protein [Paenibacillus sp. J5C2022]MCU6709392.1 hypothetical protein [Paenibacillus sp. J5C2022]
MPTPNLGLPILEQNQTADIVRDINALANSVDALQIETPTGAQAKADAAVLAHETKSSDAHIATAISTSGGSNVQAELDSKVDKAGDVMSGNLRITGGVHPSKSEVPSSDAPSTYPVGLTITRINSGTSNGYPVNLGVLETYIAESPIRSYQIITEKTTSKQFIRSVDINGTTWADSWIQIINSDGGAFTGKIELAPNVFNSAGGAMDAKNSDIKGLNGLYMADETGGVAANTGEGINYLKTGSPIGSAVISDYYNLRIGGNGDFVAGDVALRRVGGLLEYHDGTEWRPVGGTITKLSNTVRESAATEWSHDSTGGIYNKLVYIFYPKFTGEYRIAAEIKTANASSFRFGVTSGNRNSGTSLSPFALTPHYWWSSLTPLGTTGNITNQAVMSYINGPTTNSSAYVTKTLDIVVSELAPFFIYTQEDGSIRNIQIRYDYA